MTKKWVSDVVRHAVVAMSMLALSMVASAHATEIKQDAPQRYTVKKGDTLWDISGLYLEQPWRWPELWANNTQIQNPHLIYPGDVLVLRWVDGQPVLALERDKRRVVLMPGQKRLNKANAINTLPWEVLKPYIRNSWIVTDDSLESMPKVLGNRYGSVTFSDDDVVLTKSQGSSEDQYQIVRKADTIIDMQGNELGYQVKQVASAEILEDSLGSEWLVKVDNNKQEVVPGDRLWSVPLIDDLTLTLSATAGVRGNIVSGYHSHSMFGKYDVVILDLGTSDVNPGSVMGIYAQGPTVIDSDTPKYATSNYSLTDTFNEGVTVSQPAIKVGELVVFSVFDKASFALITRSDDEVKKGYIVGNP